jgi:hypothetical protein
MPVKPGLTERPGQAVVPQHVAPAQPGQPKNVVIPEHVTPVKPIQQPERVTPATSERLEKTQEKPGQQEKR